MQHLLEKIFFPYVIRPGRYIGGELGRITKDHTGKFRIALSYPDMYEVGMSYLGLSILYNIINNDERFVCERVFAPDKDAEEILRREEIPLFSLETFTPLGDFDVIGFTLAYEMVFTNVLNMIDLAGIPLRAEDRSDSHPLIIAGGPVAHNPEPMAAFFDLFCIGDAEGTIIRLLEVLAESKGQAREERLSRVVKEVPSVYVPRFYDKDSLKPINDPAPEKIKSCRVEGLKGEYYGKRPMVPFIEVVHDRLTAEIMRGCPRGCRFCQAGPIYRPVRCRPMNEIISQIHDQLQQTGYDEVSLLSLSSSDYPDIIPLTVRLSRELNDKKVALSLPSLRPGTFSQELAEAVKMTRKTGLTFAPEAGTERLRAVIRKDITDDDLYETLELVFRNDWHLVKLYFMFGLPTETGEDIEGLIDMVYRSGKIARNNKGKNVIKVSAAPFSPKAHTPFQWDQQISREESERINSYLRKRIRQSHVILNLRDPNLSYLEGIIGRGGRELADVIETAFRAGARFDGWTEGFDVETWLASFEKNGLDPDDYCRGRSFSDKLPWSHIELRQSTDYLIKERNRSSELVRSTKKHAVPDSLSKSSNNDDDERMFGRGRKKVSRPSTAAAPSRARIRVRWGRRGLVRFLSHLDNVRVMERALRRSEVPVEYTHGFHPHLKMSFGPPLQLGYTSEAEYFDLVLIRPFNSEMAGRLNDAMPEGYYIIEARPNFSGKKVSLSSKLNRAVYEVAVEKNGDYRSHIERLMAEAAVEIERVGKKETKTVDIRPAIYRLEYHDAPEGEGGVIDMELGVGSAGYVRPSEVMAVMDKSDDPATEAWRIHRKDMLYIDEEGRRLTPMEF